MTAFDLDYIKQKDDEYYTKVLNNKESLKECLKNKNSNELLDKVNDFIKNIYKASELVDSFDDYGILSNIAVKWHSVFSTMLEAPRIIKLSQPKVDWVAPLSAKNTDEVIESWVENLQQFYLSGHKENVNESDVKIAYESAKIFFSFQVLDGKINLARYLSSESYWRLEEIWLQKIKILLAYFDWLDKKSFFHDHDEHFFNATNYIRGKLLEDGIKALPSEFKEPKNYIQSRYLGVNGKLRKVNAEELEELIQSEAARIYEITGYTDEKKNWQLAENYIENYCSGKNNKLCGLEKEVFDKRKDDQVKVHAYYIYKLTGYSDAEKNRRLAETHVNEWQLDDNSLKLGWLIRKNARRIYEITGYTDEKKNWQFAETYIKQYFPGICDELSKLEKELFDKRDDFNKCKHLLVKELADDIYKLTGYSEEKKNWQLAETYINEYYKNPLGDDVFNISGLIREKARATYEITGYTDEKKNWQLTEMLLNKYVSGKYNDLFELEKAVFYKLKVFDKHKDELVKKLANDIYVMTGYSDAEKNWRLAETYVNEYQKINPLDDDSLKLSWLIRKKARRIYETTGFTSTDHNWMLAETYVKMFYENIIPAVEQNDREKVLRVLKAFQYSKTSGFLIKNCFEVALAIYFLNPKIIQSLWRESKKEPAPETNVESIALVKSWPQNFTTDEPCKTRFDISEDRSEIDFRGVMLEVERDALLKALNLATSGNPAQEHIDAIEKLHYQSRLIHEETTL